MSVFKEKLEEKNTWLEKAIVVANETALFSGLTGVMAVGIFSAFGVISAPIFGAAVVTGIVPALIANKLHGKLLSMREDPTQGIKHYMKNKSPILEQARERIQEILAEKGVSPVFSNANPYAKKDPLRPDIDASGALRYAAEGLAKATGNDVSEVIAQAIARQYESMAMENPVAAGVNVSELLLNTTTELFNEGTALRKSKHKENDLSMRA